VPASYRIDVKRRRVVEVFSGEVKLEEVLAIQSELRRDPLFDQDFDVIVNLSEMVRTKITFQSINQAVTSGELNPFSKISRSAVVAPGELGYGMARMVEAVHKGGTFEILRSMSEAEAWLAQPTKEEAS